MRISKNTFIKFCSFKENECNACEEYLEEKLSQGWMLKDIVGGFLVFKKCEPQDYKFAVDIFSGEDRREYIEYCEAAGWENICDTQKYQIFYSKDKNTTPIQTDEEMVLKKVRKSTLINLLLNIFITSTMIFNIFISSNNIYFFAENIANNNYFLLIFEVVLILILFSFYIIKDGLWYFKSNKALKLGEEIKYPTLKSFKSRMIFMDFYMSLIPVIFISTWYDYNQNRTYLYIAILILLIGILVSRIYDNLSNKKSKVVIIFTGAFSVFLATYIILSGQNTINYIDGQDKPLMSISDFTNKEINSSYLFMENSHSILASRYYYSYNDINEEIIEMENMNAIDTEDIEIKEEKRYFLDYEIFKSDNKWVMEKAFESYLTMYKYYEYDKVDEENWGALEIYKDKEYNQGYLLRYEDCIVLVSSSIDFTEKNVKFIKEKCLNWQ